VFQEDGAISPDGELVAAGVGEPEAVRVGGAEAVGVDGPVDDADVGCVLRRLAAEDRSVGRLRDRHRRDRVRFGAAVARWGDAAAGQHEQAGDDEDAAVRGRAWAASRLTVPLGRRDPRHEKRFIEAKAGST
jgi:hypothetical protein